MSNEAIRDFFDSKASQWDELANDDLVRVRSLFKRIPVKVGDRVLDCACGTGVVTGLLRDMCQAEVIGVDIAPQMIEIAKRKYEGREGICFQVGDFLEMRNGRFDLIVIYNAYPHFIHPEELAEALARNLNDGGRFALVHSIGRKALEGHHHGLNAAISRDIGSPEEEARFFEGRFHMGVLEEGADFYLVTGWNR